MPLLRELNPALSPVLVNLLQVVEEDDRDREGNAQDPGSSHKKLCTLPCKSWSKNGILDTKMMLTTATEIHGMCDSIVAVYTQCN